MTNNYYNQKFALYVVGKIENLYIILKWKLQKF